MSEPHGLDQLRTYIRHKSTCNLQAVRDNPPWDDLCNCGLRETWRDAATGLVATPDFMVADRALAVVHREDDQPCGCDDCMSYGAEDVGFDWYKVSPARRIVLRVLDSGDDRLAPVATAFREHEEATDDPS